MTSYRIEELSPDNEKDWEEFNKNIEDGSFFHTLKWKTIIENSDNYKLHYYLIYFNNKVIATCPFCESSIKGFRGLISLPNSDYRHLLISRQNYKHIEEVIKKIIEISKNQKFSFVMITTMSKEIIEYFKKFNPLLYPIFGESANLILNLKENTIDKIWNEIFKKETRKHIRKFEKDGFIIREATSIKDLREFYKYYKLNLEYKKRKPYSFSYFKKLWDEYYPTDLRITLLCKGENVHGGVLGFIYHPTKTIHLCYISIDRNLPGRYNTTDYLHWEYLQYASEKKINTVSFGETPLDCNDVTYRNKKKFGCDSEKIYSLIFPFSFSFRFSYYIYKYLNLPQQFKNIKEKFESKLKIIKDSNNLENIEKPIAIIFGNDSVSILGLIRNFQKENVPFIILNSEKKRQLFSYSKYCINSNCPDPINNEKKFITFLLNLGKKLKIKGVLFPTSDIYVHILLKYRKLLEQYFYFSSAELNVVDKLLNKHIFYKILEEQKISHPKTFFPKNIDELQKISEEISFPCIIKPAYSGYFRLNFKVKFFIVKNKGEIIQYYDILSKKNQKLVIQEIIHIETGNQYGLNAYYDLNNNPHGVFMYKKMRDLPIFGGVGCYLQNVEIPELEQITTSFIKKIKYYGIVDAEFIKDTRDDSFKLIEINPRVWLQNTFPLSQGINLPYIAYMNTIGKKFETFKSDKDSIIWLHFYEDFISALSSIKIGKLSFHEWMESYRGKKMYAIFSWDDPLPAFILIIKIIFVGGPYLVFRKIKDNLSTKLIK